MKITTPAGSTDIKVQTITLSHLRDEPTRVYLFHCFRCGNPMNQVQGGITRIFPGLSPTPTVTIIQKCKQCGELYTFQTQDDRRSPQPIRVILSTFTPNNTFHCPICITPLLQFNQFGVVLLPEFIKQEIPFIVKCLRKGCPGRYRIVDLI